MSKEPENNIVYVLDKDLEKLINERDTLQEELKQMANCLKDCLTLIEEHGNKVIMAHASRLSNFYTVLYNYQKSQGIIK